MHEREEQDEIAPTQRRLPLARGVLAIGANVAHEAEGYSECVGGNGANVLFIECDEQAR
jgi:hypothetical protein